MPIEGSLREFALHDIFQLLHLSRKTGELKIVQQPAGTRGVVVFKAGAVVGADLDEASPRLGYMLLNAGKIREADLQRASQLRAENPVLAWRDIFDSLDVVARQDLERYVKIEVEEFVYEILAWRDGRFLFVERLIRDSECATWIPVESILMERARRADELSALSTTIEDPSAVPRLSGRAADEGGILDLSPDEWEVVGRVDGVSDVRSIAHTLGRNEFEISKVISGLAEQGLLEIGSEVVAPAKPPHEIALDKVEDLLKLGELDAAHEQLEPLLSSHPDEPRTHYLDARVQEERGDLVGAAEGYEIALNLDPLAEDARQRLGLVRLRLGDVEGAAREWAAYLRMAADGTERRRVERAMTVVRELQTILGEFNGREHP
jgi:tetratricopeptide (TPR) repeat protein